jgi:hypothetical protein
MNMGITFPVRCGDKTVDIAWGLLAPHRAEIQKTHGRTLEYLAGHGGLAREELVSILGEKALPKEEKTPSKGGKP